MSNPAVCFTCGMPTGDPMRLNHLPSGQVCGACRDRLLELLPAPFPMRAGVVQPEAELDDDDYGATPEPQPVRRRRPRSDEPA